VDESLVHTISREEVFEAFRSDMGNAVYTHMEPDGSILFV